MPLSIKCWSSGSTQPSLKALMPIMAGRPPILGAFNVVDNGAAFVGHHHPKQMDPRCVGKTFSSTSGLMVKSARNGVSAKPTTGPSRSPCRRGWRGPSPAAGLGNECSPWRRGARHRHSAPSSPNSPVTKQMLSTSWAVRTMSSTSRSTIGFPATRPGAGDGQGGSAASTRPPWAR